MLFIKSNRRNFFIFQLRRAARCSTVIRQNPAWSRHPATRTLTRPGRSVHTTFGAMEKSESK